jgi:hypothetical protein
MTSVTSGPCFPYFSSQLSVLLLAFYPHMAKSLEDTRAYFSLGEKLNPQFETNLPSRSRWSYPQCRPAVQLPVLSTCTLRNLHQTGARLRFLV